MAPIKIRGRAAASIVMAIAVGACSSAGTPRSASTTSRPATPSSGAAAPAPTPAALAADAYVWGLPLVVSMRTAQTFARLIGVNHLFNQQKLSAPGRGIVVAPNVDTLYSIAVIDLRSGPVVLTVPAIHDRYYTYQFLDMYTESFAYVGTRATAGAAGSWIVAPPGWAGAVPVGDHLIRDDTAGVSARPVPRQRRERSADSPGGHGAGAARASGVERGTLISGRPIARRAAGHTPECPQCGSSVLRRVGRGLGRRPGADRRRPRGPRPLRTARRRTRPPS